MTANAELADQLRRQADDATMRRRVLLCAAVALATTTSVPAATGSCASGTPARRPSGPQLPS